MKVHCIRHVHRDCDETTDIFIFFVPFIVIWHWMGGLMTWRPLFVCDKHKNEYWPPHKPKRIITPTNTLESVLKKLKKGLKSGNIVLSKKPTPKT